MMRLMSCVFIASAIILPSILSAEIALADKPSVDQENIKQSTLLPVRLWPEPASVGAALFVEKCAMCHREKGMGTGLLSRRLNIALLEDRRDLSSDAVVAMARIGVGNMPRISRGEVSDEQLLAIANYLGRVEAVK